MREVETKGVSVAALPTSGLSVRLGEHVLIMYPYRASCGAASLLCFHSGLLCLAPFLSTEHSPPLLQNPLLYFISLFSTRSGQRAKE